ncbi:MAG: sulfurtransferase TusA family protein [Mangrovicoccus sp.]
MTDHFPHASVDALGLLCPLPVLKARKRLSEMAPGEILELLTDDPASQIDVPHYCQESGQTLLDAADTDKGFRFLIQKPGA